MAAAEFRFVRSPGQGMRLEEDETRRATLRALVGGGVVLSKNERIDRLLMLMSAEGGRSRRNGWQSGWTLSEHTLSGDLNTAADWLLARDLSVGVGVWLEGIPESLRRAMGVRLRLQLTQMDWQQFLESCQGGTTLELLDQHGLSRRSRVYCRALSAVADLCSATAHLLLLCCT